MELQPWIQIAKELGVFTVIGALITFLLTRIFSKYFDRQVDQFKSELKHKYYRLERLHEKRSEVIVNLYEYLVDLEDSFQIMTATLKPGGDNFDDSERKRIEEAGSNYNQVRNYFKKNEILFSEPICEKMNQVITTSHEIVSDYQFYVDYNREDFHIYKEVIEKVNTKLPNLKKILKKELRMIMKVEVEQKNG